MIIQVVVGYSVVCLAYGVGTPGAVRQPTVGLLGCAGFCILPDQSFISVEVVGGLAVGCLADPSVERIVCIAYGLSVGQGYLGQSVACIVAVLCGLAVFSLG